MRVDHTVVFGGVLIPRSMLCNEDQIRAEMIARLPRRQYEVIVFEPRFNHRVASFMCKDVIQWKRKELMAFPMSRLAARHCLLFLWCESYTLKIAMDLLVKWGFEYKSVFHVLLKRYKSGMPSSGGGHFTSPSAEFLLVACTPQTPYLSPKWRANTPPVPQEFHALAADTRRPATILGTIEAMYPNRNGYLHLCAPGPRTGWDCWGTALPEFFSSLHE
jgi:N6-adenosine-specific RNA methylase IME4